MYGERQRAIQYRIVDQQVRSIDVGKAQVGIGMVTRGKLTPGGGGAEAVAEHEQVSEVYYVIDGSATLLTGPDIDEVRLRELLVIELATARPPGAGDVDVRLTCSGSAVACGPVINRPLAEIS